MRRTALHIVTRLHSAHPARSPSNEELTERGLSALAAARKGAELYVWKNGGWQLASPAERAHAEILAITNPIALVAYAAMPAKRRRRRR